MENTAQLRRLVMIGYTKAGISSSCNSLSGSDDYSVSSEDS